MDLTTNYLGLKLKNPLVPSASPLSKKLDTAKALEDAGASALVMYSLFEEEIHDEEAMLDQLMVHADIGHTEADSYLPSPFGFKDSLELYLEQISKLKQSLDIPVIASLNGITNSGWIRHATDMEEAGADALELNIYYIPTTVSESATDVEQGYIDIIKAIKTHIKIPLICKINSQFSSPGHFVKQLEAAGVNGVALFNRFYQPDIDLETLKINPGLTLSNPYEALLRMHWVALLREHTNITLAATGGVHSVDEVIKLLLVGADVTHLCSALLQQGPELLSKIRDDLENWLDENDYESVEQLKGSVSQGKAINPIAFERLNYLEVLSSFKL